MLNNGQMNMGGCPPEVVSQGQIFGGGNGSGDYGNSYLGHQSNGPPNGIGSHHHSGGGVCSQMINPNPSPPNPTCSGCGGPIMERFLLQSLDRYWHERCLKCTACNVQLANVAQSCYTRDGMILCKSDYARLFGSSGACQGCSMTIPPTDYVMKTGGLPNGLQLLYHVKCFICFKCGIKLNAGDRYSVLNGSLYCEQDAIKVLKNGIGSPSNSNIGNNGPTSAAPRKGKVGRPRRSRD